MPSVGRAGALAGFSRLPERLRALMRRSDAFNNALAVVEGEEGVRPDVRAECLEVLGEASREANEAFARYREEVGIPDPTMKNV